MPSNISSEFLALKTDGEMLENVKSPVKSIKPMLRDRSRSVRGKRKRKGDTIFIVEKQVPMMSNQMMASAGKAKLNITEQLSTLHYLPLFTTSTPDLQRLDIT